MKTGKKRIAVLLAVSLSLGVLLAGCGSSGDSTSGDSSEDKPVLVINEWGGDYTDKKYGVYFDEFEEEYNCEIQVVSPIDTGKIKTMVETGNVEYDIVNCDGDFVFRGAEEGLLEPIDYSVVTNTADWTSGVYEYGVMSDPYYGAITYNTSQYTEDTAPKSWADFFDTEKFPGKRAMLKQPTFTLEAALLADGVAPEDLYPLDVDRALAKLDTIKDDITVWTTTGAEQMQVLASGDVDMSCAWTSRSMPAEDAGEPVGVSWNQALLYDCGWVVVKDAPHKELAMQFIQFATDPQRMADFMNIVYTGSHSDDARALVGDDRLNTIGFTDEQMASSVTMDLEYWANNYDEVNEKFQAWLIS